MTLFQNDIVGIGKCVCVCVCVCKSACLQDGGGAEGGGHAQTLVLNDARLWLLVYIGASCDWLRRVEGTQRRSAGGRVEGLFINPDLLPWAGTATVGRVKVKHKQRVREGGGERERETVEETRLWRRLRLTGVRGGGEAAAPVCLFSRAWTTTSASCNHPRRARPKPGATTS